MPTYWCPKSVKGYAIGVTRENECGVALDPLTPNARIRTAGFAKATFSPDIEGGVDITTKLASGAICIREKDCDRLKGFNVELMLCGVPLPLLEMLVDLTMLDNPSDPTDFIGGVLRDSLSSDCTGPKLIEIWSKNNDLASCGVGGVGSKRYMRWMLPFTDDWEITGDIVISEEQVDVTLTGYAQKNPNWFPSLPGPTFPSYVPGGGDPDSVPTGPAPAVLPDGVTADPWSLDHQDAIQAGGPLAWIADSALPELESCDYMAVTAS